MSFYSVCSLNICADLLPNSYLPFLADNSNVIEDIKFIRVYQPISTKHMQKVIDLSYVTIWRDTNPNNDFCWIYESRTGICSLLINSDYSIVELYYSDMLDSLSEEIVKEFISPYIRLAFECKMIQKGIISLHAACIEMNNRGFAFSGPSGIGKSSRAKKFCELFSANWVSGDRPAIDTKKGLVYGVPWDGKEGIYRNIKLPLSMVCIIKRSEKTNIREISEEEKQQFFFQQTFCPLWDSALVSKVYYAIKSLMHSVPIYELACSINDESICKAYEMIMEKVKCL